MTSMRSAWLAAGAVALALALAGCGERPQTISYKQGTYQGKPDARPAAAQFNGNQQQWENEIKTRNQFRAGSPEMQRGWEFWAKRAGCGEMLADGKGGT